MSSLRAEQKLMLLIGAGAVAAVGALIYLYYERKKEKIDLKNSALNRKFRQICSPKSDVSFSIMTWNVLADSLSDSFPFVDKSILSFEHRKKLYFPILIEHNYDIICLQEVDHYDDFFKPELGQLGYEGVWKTKFYNKPGDGVAIFWKKNIWNLQRHEVFRFDENETQFAHIALLNSLDPKVPSLCVATTHLKAKLGFEERRKIQGTKLLEQIQKVNTENYPVVVCGDFNDTPDSLVCGKMRKLFTSAYSGEGWTTWKKRESEVKRTIDYIWYDQNSFRLTHTLDIPKDEQLPNLMPSVNYPSDHLALGCRLETKVNPAK